jgi:hypothetical protein
VLLWLRSINHANFILNGKEIEFIDEKIYITERNHTFILKLHGIPSIKTERINTFKTKVLNQRWMDLNTDSVVFIEENQ